VQHECLTKHDFILALAEWPWSREGFQGCQTHQGTYIPFSCIATGHMLTKYILNQSLIGRIRGAAISGEGELNR
jgi:hypothetical protein